jgi:hypothetical protein
MCGEEVSGNIAGEERRCLEEIRGKQRKPPE